MPAFKSPLFMGGNEIKEFTIDNVSQFPANPRPGRAVFYATWGAPGHWNGSQWRPWDAGLLTDGSIKIAALEKNPLDRANHTGSQKADSISDFDGQVRKSRLDQFAIPQADVNFGSYKLTGLKPAEAATDAVTLAQTQTLIAQAISGQKAIKNPAKVAATKNIVLSGLQTVDDVSVQPGDRVLAPFQTNGREIGLYTAASGAWVRALDADEPTEWTEGTEILVNQGTTYGGTIWRQTTPDPITVGTTVMNFTQVAKQNNYLADGSTLSQTGNVFSAKLSPSKGLISDGNGIAVDPNYSARKAVGSFPGDGTTSQFTIKHDLNNARPAVQFFDKQGNPVGIDWIPLDANNIRVTFGPASIPAAGDTYGVSIYG